MKKIINRYFDLIGVENEGYRRVLSILIIISCLILPFSFGVSNINFYLELIFFQGHIDDSLFFYFLILFPSPIIIGVIVKITTVIFEFILGQRRF